MGPNRSVLLVVRADLLRLYAGSLFDTIQFDFFGAKQEQQCFFNVLQFGGVFLDGSSTAEVLEGFDIQHLGQIPFADHSTCQSEDAPNVTTVLELHSTCHELCIIPLLGKPTIHARLRWHRRFDGIYARIAKNLRVDASYVSRVADGTRNSESVMQALEVEMRRLEKLKPK
jgi:hypothetical protein